MNYNPGMDEHRRLPDANRLSVLAATILLAYALTRFIKIPGQAVEFQAPGVFFSFPFNFLTIVSLLVAALAASGMMWLVSDHPGLNLATNKGFARQLVLLPHWLLPALTAWAIGVPLGNASDSPEWWIVFGMGGILLILVFIAEYIVVDATDIRHPHAAAGLTALSFALYLILAIAMRSAGMRLILALPGLTIAAGLVSLRTLYLRLGNRWAFAWAFAISFITGQITIGLHYLPISPISFSLLLLGPLYALTAFAGAWQEGSGLRRSIGEPLLMLSVLWVLALILQ